ncbi:uncharacterized protein J7T54_003815 [Emericellopsis cladophorae]|uniref:Uncharacterized protein n=1 Tax=Emericellopsis cladophorae TaxID=2686198 RepID=A0A9Q0BBF1_9HYPO|nr:uncharacterized protein J7T54_003815 [Emericellopsis cladophorae]KAI6777994.1 hypothetical protein J7T54_003815 [Emericellopsis cladophorae]
MSAPKTSKRFASLRPESKATIGEKLQFWRDTRRDTYSILSDKTQSSRDQLWEDWQAFFSQIGEDPEQIWLDLCDNKDEARSLCLVFLEVCVENSQTLRPVLGPEENAYVQTITSANALLQIWKGLIAHADEKVLDQARKRDPKNRAHWTLKYTNHDGGRNRGPANRVASAFTRPFTSVEDLLTLPRLEGVDYLEVSWKPEMADKEIIPIKYHQYYKIWRLVNLAAGFRDGLRPTSMRVGAGARIVPGRAPRLYVALPPQKIPGPLTIKVNARMP